MTPNMKTSPSNQSLSSQNSSRLGRRTPTNIEIQRHSRPEKPDFSDTVSESAVTSGNKKNSGKKEVTSKIASLWKKVEDSKKKENQQNKKDPNNANSKKVWISKGRVIPESDMAYLRPDEAQKKIINDFQKSKNNTSNSENSPMKTRSRSRLSIKLSKFKSSSNPLKKENSFTYTSHRQQQPMTSTSVPSTPNVEQMKPLQKANPDSSTSKNSSKRLSRIGSFLNPNDEKTSKAIVPPFNYSPPIQSDENAAKKANNVVRRNDSYVTSMGRVREQLIKKKATENSNAKHLHHEEETQEIMDEGQSLDETSSIDGAPTSSVLVTMV